LFACGKQYISSWLMRTTYGNYPAIEFTHGVSRAALQINDRTCLHAAAATGNVDVLGMLLQHSNFNLVGRMGPRLPTVVLSCIVQANALPI
jgi:ankyrin repeat protein